MPSCGLIVTILPPDATSATTPQVPTVCWASYAVASFKYAIRSARS